MLNPTYLTCIYTALVAAILPAEDKADTKIPLYTKVDSNISMSAAAPARYGTVGSLNMASECTPCSVFFVNNIL